MRIILTRQKFLYLCVFALLFFVALKPLSDPDLWMHLRIGQEILTTQSIPSTDLLSFSAFGQPYVYHFWLSSVILDLTYKAGGLLGVMFLYASLTALGGLFLLLIKSSRSVTDVFIGSLVLVFTFVNLGERTQVFSFVCFSILFFLLSKQGFIEQNISQILNRKKLIYLICIPVLMLIWANLHGGFIWGMGLLGFLLIWKLVSNINFWSKLKFVGLCLMSFLATALNPYGFSIYQQAITMIVNPVAHELNADWWSVVEPRLIAIEPQYLIVATVLVFASIILFRSKNVSFVVKALLLLATVAAFFSRRFLVPWGVIASPYLVLVLCETIQARINSTIKWFGALFLVSIMGLVLLGNFANAIWVSSDVTRYGTFSETPRFPFAVLANVEEITGRRILNEYVWGGYLEWFVPESRVFIDTRMDNIYLPNQKLAISEFSDLVNLNPGWSEIFDGYNFELLLLKADRPLVQKLRANPNWQVVFDDGDAVMLKVVAPTALPEV